MALRNYSATAGNSSLSLSVNSTATSFTVASVSGFPAAPFTVVVDPGEATQEVALVTAVSSNVMTVSRGFDSTPAVGHAAGAVIQHCHTAIDFREANAHVNATDAHGTTGGVVGRTNAQTLTNKSIDLATNTMTGTVAQFNTAVTDGDFATTAQTAPTASGLAAHIAATTAHGTSGAVVGTTDAQALTNKTVQLGSNTVRGSRVDFNLACTDADFVYANSPASIAPVNATGWTASVRTKLTDGLGFLEFTALRTGANIPPTSGGDLSPDVIVASWLGADSALMPTTSQFGTAYSESGIAFGAARLDPVGGNLNVYLTSWATATLGIQTGTTLRAKFIYIVGT